EADRRAVRAAAEAVIELLLRADRERWRLLVVKGTAGVILAPDLLQRHARIDHLDDVEAVDEVVDEGLGDAGHCVPGRSEKGEGRRSMAAAGAFFFLLSSACSLSCPGAP